MGNVDVGKIGQNVITILGGASGGYIVAAALLVCFLLVAVGWVGQHRILHTLYAGIGAWISAWIVASIIQWKA